MSITYHYVHPGECLILDRIGILPGYSDEIRMIANDEFLMPSKSGIYFIWYNICNKTIILHQINITKILDI